MLITVLYLGKACTHAGELPQLTLVRMLGALFITTVVGGLLGVLAPGFEFTAPMEVLLPGWLADHPFVHNLIHPTVSPDPAGARARRAAPRGPVRVGERLGRRHFHPDHLVRGRVVGVRRPGARRVALRGADRPGRWCRSCTRSTGACGSGSALSVLYSSCCTAARPRPAARGGGRRRVAGPLARSARSVTKRLDSPHSNDIRDLHRDRDRGRRPRLPVIGYGNTRNARGNHRSITTGQDPEIVPRACAHPPLGSDGQLWLLLITQGFTGAALYIAFFAGAIRRYWRDRTPIGQAGVLVDDPRPCSTCSSTTAW